MKSSKTTEKAKGSKSNWSKDAMTSQSSTATISRSKMYGAHQKADKVTFVAFYPDASVVHLAGDFNNWRPEENPMLKTGEGTWKIVLSLPKGTYRYRFVVDGKWQEDPYNTKTEPNQYGELNSVITAN